MGAADGFSAAVEAAVAEAGPMLPLGDAVQLDLLRAELGSEGAAVVEARRRGRPPGAANKRTLAMRSYLLGRYAHPLEVLAQLYSRPVELLAAEIGCTKLEALDRQIKAAVELAPYVEGKMPVSVDVSVRSDLSIVIPGLNAPLGTVDDVAAMIRIDGLQDQEVSGE